MQEKNVTIANGLQVTLKTNDKVELLDGRILTVKTPYGRFGKVELVGEDNSVAFAKPIDIIRIIQDVVETVERAKGFWAWFKNSEIGTTVIQFIKSKFGKK
jgi:hypothetical protein